MRQDIGIADQGFEAIPSDQKQGVILASNGLFTFRRLMLGQLTLVDLVRRIGPGYAGPGMLPINEGFVFNAPRITRADLQQVESFFRQVWREYHAEAIVFLFYSPALEKWRVTAVPQRVAPTHLDWETPGATPNGWYIAGSIHSHGANMDAFHSPTDKGDEINWNGIHITIGRVMSPNVSISAEIVIGGERFKVEIDQLVEPSEEVKFPAAWRNQVSKYVPPVPAKVLALGGRLTRRGRQFSGGADDEKE